MEVTDSGMLVHAVVWTTVTVLLMLWCVVRLMYSLDKDIEKDSLLFRVTGLKK